MDANSVKQSVVESYGKLANTRKNGILSKLFACCDQHENAKLVAKKIGYSSDVIDQIPEAANLGVGCGNPSAIAQIQAGDTVVDLGAGAGFDAFIVAQQVGKKGSVLGIDLSDDMIDLARKNAAKGDFSQVEFIKGDIEEIPLKDNIADHVISNCVINLSLNKDKVYKEAYRILKDGGRLAISDIVLERELPDFIKDSLVGHIACVSGAEKLEDYLSYVTDAGFTDVKIESKSDFPLELMLTDPQVMRLAQEMNFNLDSEEARDIASRVTSISLSARK